MNEPKDTTPSARRPIPLRRLVTVDRAVTDLPIPVGEGQWGWWRRHAHRIRVSEESRARLRRAEVVLTVDTAGRPAGIAYGEEALKRIVESGQAESLNVLTVRLDRTSLRMGGKDMDFELLVAALRVAKDEDLDDQGDDDEKEG